MKLPYGSTVDEFPIYTPFNHNHLGNPHNQYNIPIITVNSLASVTNMAYKIFETEKIPSSYFAFMKFVAEVYSSYEGSLNQKIDGLLDVQILKKGDGNFYTDIKFNPKTNVKSTSFSGIFKAYLHKENVGAANETYTIQLYFIPQQTYETVFIVPYIIDIKQNKSWSSFMFDYVRRDNYIIYSKTVAIDRTTITDTLLGQSVMPGPFVITFSSGSVVDTTNIGTILLNPSAAATLSTFQNGDVGQTILLIAQNGNTTIGYSSSGLSTKTGDSPVVPANGKMLFRKADYNSLWIEVYRSF